jgi:hypothetical protein
MTISYAAKNGWLIVLLGIIFVLLIITGYKSKKLRKMAVELLKKKSDLEITKLKTRVQDLKKKASELDETRRTKAVAYRQYIHKLNAKRK